jgi:hypothetical protein
VRVFLIIIFSFNIAQAETRFGSLNHDVLKHYDQQVRNELVKNKTSEKEIYKILMDASEYLLSYGYYEFASKYFKEATRNSNAQLHAYNRVLACAKLLDRKDEHIKWVGKTEAFLMKSPDHKSGQKYQRYIVEKHHFSITPSTSDERKALEKTNFYGRLLLSDATYFYKKKDYSKTFAILKKFDLKHADIKTKLMHDDAMVESKAKGELLCSKVYKRYPASPSVHMKTCKKLMRQRK